MYTLPSPMPSHISLSFLAVETCRFSSVLPTEQEGVCRDESYRNPISTVVLPVRHTHTQHTTRTYAHAYPISFALLPVPHNIATLRKCQVAGSEWKSRVHACARTPRDAGDGGCGVMVCVLCVCVCVSAKCGVHTCTVQYNCIQYSLDKAIPLYNRNTLAPKTLPYLPS